MTYQTITFELSDGVAVLKLNRPEVMHALNSLMRAEITDAVRSLSQEARVLVLTAEGKAFCSGQDLSDRANVATPDMERTLRDEYLPMLRAIVDCPVPVISAVNGAAAGAGANLALCADVVIATQSAYFLQAFTRIGLVPDAGGTYFLPRSMGMAKTMGAALFAEPVTAQQASDWGMIWEAVPDESFETHWKARAAHLATGPSLAYGEIKKIVRATWNNDMEEQLALEGKSQGACGVSRDFKEGVMAFLEKRPAHFEGR
ncbi:enoyl-CoA hydratase-related protein [Pseudooceanicola sp. HF7]|uniref:enoyl-CoA hydratase-related protein n=1 Tax=Pseudooceanicola sp. HF7 TaxID=2721560 RepID=UPI00142F963D|nr:enoyl-CoA hydratase-related protein [Pseudooceanicola sp. HF7]NIZ10296.1 2-(1,2-epoxy-1,2-dihydrophenyl)acetyl-CoA isomerase [Pseudooceanicola sp. HF7]